MFGLGTSELIIIFAILLLVFGASKLPALGKGLGEGIRSFKDGLKNSGLKEAEKELKDLEKTE